MADPIADVERLIKAVGQVQQRQESAAVAVINKMDTTLVDILAVLEKPDAPDEPSEEIVAMCEAIRSLQGAIEKMQPAAAWTTLKVQFARDSLGRLGDSMTITRA